MRIGEQKKVGARRTSRWGMDGGFEISTSTRHSQRTQALPLVAQLCLTRAMGQHVGTLFGFCAIMQQCTCKASHADEDQAYLEPLRITIACAGWPSMQAPLSV